MFIISYFIIEDIKRLKSLSLMQLILTTTPRKFLTDKAGEGHGHEESNVSFNSNHCLSSLFSQ